MVVNFCIDRYILNVQLCTDHVKKGLQDKKKVFRMNTAVFSALHCAKFVKSGRASKFTFTFQLIHNFTDFSVFFSWALFYVLNRAPIHSLSRFEK